MITKKNIGDSIKDALIITVTTTEIFFALNVTNVKPLKASLDAMNIMKLAGSICGGVLVKDFPVYKKWIKEGVIQQKNFGPPKGNKITFQ